MRAPTGSPPPTTRSPGCSGWRPPTSPSWRTPPRPSTRRSRASPSSGGTCWSPAPTTTSPTRSPTCPCRPAWGWRWCGRPTCPREASTRPRWRASSTGGARAWLRSPTCPPAPGWCRRSRRWGRPAASAASSTWSTPASRWARCRWMRAPSAATSSRPPPASSCAARAARASSTSPTACWTWTSNPCCRTCGAPTGSTRTSTSRPRTPPGSRTGSSPMRWCWRPAKRCATRTGWDSTTSASARGLWRISRATPWARWTA